MAQIIIKRTGVQRKDAMGCERIPCRSIYVYPRGKRHGGEVEVFQQHRWHDDARWKTPALNWGASYGGYMTIQQAEVFRDTLNTAIRQAKALDKESKKRAAG